MKITPQGRGEWLDEMLKGFFFECWEENWLIFDDQIFEILLS